MEIILTVTLLEVTLIVTLLAGFFLLYYVLKLKKNKPAVSNSDHYTEPVISKAIILSFENTGVFIQGHVQMKLQVQVMPVNRRNFVTEISEMLTAEYIKNIRVGNTIWVRYDPVKRKEVSLVKAA